nr:MAG TPA: hypothetical protein [Bacteriophage sp.]
MVFIKALNPDIASIPLALCRCVKSQYQRNSLVNFTKPTGGRAATAVIVEYD